METDRRANDDPKLACSGKVVAGKSGMILNELRLIDRYLNDSKLHIKQMVTFEQPYSYMMVESSNNRI